MKKFVFMFTVFMMIAWTVTAFAEPYAPLAPRNAFGKQAMASNGQTMADVQKELPTKEMVEIPAYPGSYFGSAGKSNGILSTIQLIAKDSPEKVIAWYKKNLGKDWQYVPDLITEQLGEVGVFVQTDNPNVDAFDSLKYRQIRIAKVEKPEDTGFLGMFLEMKGIKSMITVQIKPFM